MKEKIECNHCKINVIIEKLTEKQRHILNSIYIYTFLKRFMERNEKKDKQAYHALTRDCLI